MESEKNEMGGFLRQLPFVRELGIEPVTFEPGRVIVTMPFAERFSSPPDLFPASIIGAIGDVAAVSACASMAPKGCSVATLDFTIKVTNQAHGDALRAEGRILQAGKTISTAMADIWVMRNGEAIHCGSLLATARVFRIGA